MKGLTVLQPYAHLIVRGEKRVENRTWFTSYTGPLLIHAGKGDSYLGANDVAYYQEIGDPMPFGAIVGIARRMTCLSIYDIEAGRHRDTYPWIEDHPHTEGPWCWVLHQVHRFEQPIPCKGARRLWDVPKSIIEMLPHEHV